MKFVTRYWYNQGLKSPSYLNILSTIYGFVSNKRRLSFLNKKKQTYRAPVPVIVIGNITVGGTGKTPLVIALARFLVKNGYQVGIISRGYGGNACDWPLEVYSSSDPALIGDEPLLIAQQSLCPVFVGPNRKEDIQALIKKYPEIDVILSDDGMQHYAMERDIEIAVIDGKRLFGNEKLIPAGPLREPIARLDEVNIQVINGCEPNAETGDQNRLTLPNVFLMQLVPEYIYRLNDKSQRKKLSEFAGKTVHGVAGIGNPQRFMDALRAQGLEVIAHEFDDHFHYEENDLIFSDELSIIMTEKDAVKCINYNLEDCWVAAVDAQLDHRFYEEVLHLLDDVIKTENK